MKELNTYSVDELKKLYKSFSLYIVTEYLIEQKNKLNKKIIDLNRKAEKEADNRGTEFKAAPVPLTTIHFKNEKTETIKNTDDYDRATIKVINNLSTASDSRVFNSMRIDNIKRKLVEQQYKSENEKEKLRYEMQALNVINNVLFWCTDCFEELEENYIKNPDNFKDPEEMYFELHMNDEENIKYSRATDMDIYTFIWETLQWCDVKDLRRLINYADKKFIINAPYRPAINKKVYKYNKNGDLLATFENRADCIKQENIKKQALSHVLSGKRKTLNGFIYKEED